MTSAHKKSHSRQAQPLQRGFTILEMVITMAIVATVVGSAVFILGRSGDDSLNFLTRETQLIAKDSMREAVSERRPHYMVLSHDKIWSTSSVNTGRLRDLKPQEGDSVITLDPGVEVAYRFDNASDWITIRQNEEPLIWTFSQSGLCEQLSIRYSSENGYSSDTFHPLTAGSVIDED